MNEYRAQIILGCVLGYFVLCIGIGLWAMRRTKSTRDFFMAGRNLGILVTAAAVFSSTMSGFGFVGGPGLVYRMGMSSVWITISVVLGYAVCFFLLGKRLRMFGGLKESISLPDAVATRYNSPAAGGLTALAILLGVMGYLAAQIFAMATVLQGLLESVEGIGSISIAYCAAISTAILVFYSVTGGIIASVYTDLIQGFIMMIAAVLVFFVAMNAVDGGFAGMTTTLLEDDPGSISPWGTIGMIGALSWFFVFALGMSGQPHVITKLMMSRKVEDARRTLPLAIAGYALTSLLWIGIGLAMRALVLQGKHESLAYGDEAAPMFLQTFTHPILAGVVFAGLFAAIMSTADAFLNIGAAAVVHDIPRAIRGKSLKRELLWARTTTVIIAVVATLFALYTRDLVAILGAFGWGTFAAAIVPTVAIGFNWKRATPQAACGAILASLIVNGTLKIGGFTVPFGIDVGAVALIVSLTLFFAISLMTPQPKLDPQVERMMDL